MTVTIVPIYADLLSVAAKVSETKEQTVTRSVEVASGESQFGKLAADRTPMQHIVIGLQSFRLSVEELKNRGGRELAMFKGARDSFPHKRIYPSGITGQQHPASGERLIGGVPSYGKCFEAKGVLCAA